jgi:hypothetical protein
MISFIIFITIILGGRRAWRFEFEPIVVFVFHPSADLFSKFASKDHVSRQKVTGK